MAQHDPSHVASSQKALMLELKSLQEEPVEGFKITLVDEADLYNWEVAIFGPPNTHYEGGYFKVRRYKMEQVKIENKKMEERQTCTAVFCFLGSDQVSYRLPILPTCFPLPHQNVASQHL